jgi:hypothetical protein
MKMALKTICLTSGGLWLALVLPASAATQTIFDNSVNDYHVRFNPGTNMVGDQIILGGSPSFRNLSMFSFEYWGTNTANPTTFAGDVKAEVRFFLNDGPLGPSGYNTPGTMFYDSGLFSIVATNRSTLVFSGTGDFGGGYLVLPAEEFTWTVQFSGMDLTDSVGLDIYSAPVVGQDYPDYWEYQGGSWMLLTNDLAIPMNFAARMDAVPEPSTAVLSIIGGLGLLAAAGKLRRTAS